MEAEKYPNIQKTESDVVTNLFATVALDHPVRPRTPPTISSNKYSSFKSTNACGDCWANCSSTNLVNVIVNVS